MIVPIRWSSANAVWAPDSRTLAVVNDVNGLSALHLVATRDRRRAEVDLGDAVPLTDLAFRPPDGAELLVRGGVGATASTIPRSFQSVAPAPGCSGIRAEMLFGRQWENGGPAWSPDGAADRLQPGRAGPG